MLQISRIIALLLLHFSSEGRGLLLRHSFSASARIWRHLTALSKSSSDSLDSSAKREIKKARFALKNHTHHELHFPSDIDYKNTTSIAFNGPSSHHMLLEWHDTPKRILFLAKPDIEMISKLFDAVTYLWEKDVDIVFEQNVFELLSNHEPFQQWTDSFQDDIQSQHRLSLFTPGNHDSGRDHIDLVITFGGDGLLLHCNNIFSKTTIPPVMCFDFGSLGFLTPFQYENFRAEIDNVLKGSVLVTLRMRLECTIFRQNEETDTYSVLNEAVVDRGPSPFLSVLDLNCNSHYLTTLQGDGMIFATPTGSTAYSLSAGGSIVYPSVPAILLTPVCAHSLSFRPMLLPDSAVLTCDVPLECRASAWVSFDGKHRQELHRGDRLRIRMSPYPLPTINRKNYTEDWFDSLRAGFMFNLRPRQKSTI